MQTVFISANDTGSGKTYVAAALACRCVQRGQRVQYVKAVETGVTAHTAAGQTDAGCVAAFVQRHAAEHCAALSTHTLQRFSEPMAPVDAARIDGAHLDFDALADAVNALPRDNAHWRIVEGAGGLAVPLETGATPRDWADFAHAIHADATVLVVADRLGSINQARLLAAYAQARNLRNAGLWLNATTDNVPQQIRNSNTSALNTGAAALPLWATHAFNTLWPQEVRAPWTA